MFGAEPQKASILQQSCCSSCALWAVDLSARPEVAGRRLSGRGTLLFAVFGWCLGIGPTLPAVGMLIMPRIHRYDPFERDARAAVAGCLAPFVDCPRRSGGEKKEKKHPEISEKTKKRKAIQKKRTNHPSTKVSQSRRPGTKPQVAPSRRKPPVAQFSPGGETSTSRPASWPLSKRGPEEVRNLLATPKKKRLKWQPNPNR